MTTIDRTARIVIKRDGVVTLNGERQGKVTGWNTRHVGGYWAYVADKQISPCGANFTRYSLDAVRRELYRRLSAPLSGR